MPDINPSLPIVGQPDSSEEPKIVTALSQLIAAVNDVDTDQIADGAVQAVDLQSALADLLGVSIGSTKRRGVVNIPGSESVSSTTYALMGTPDKVTVTLPTDGLLLIGYEATWSGAGGRKAAVFLGTNQLKIPGNVSGGASPQTQAALGQGGALVSSSIGLVSPSGAHTTVETGLIIGGAIGGNPVALAYELGGTAIIHSNVAVALGGPIMVRAAAGTYDVQVKFSTATGSVTASNRRLWALALGF